MADVRRFMASLTAPQISSTLRAGTESWRGTHKLSCPQCLCHPWSSKFCPSAALTLARLIDPFRLGLRKGGNMNMNSATFFSLTLLVGKFSQICFECLKKCTVLRIFSLFPSFPIIKSVNFLKNKLELI